MAGKVYLSGPDRLLPDGKRRREEKAELCGKYGFEVDPLPDAYFDPLLPPEKQRELALLRIQRIRECDAVIADVNDFRFSVEPYGESAMELGIAYPLGKRMICYMDDVRSCGERYPGPKLRNEKGRYTDMDGNGFEPTCLNLMLSQSAEVVEGGLEEALHRLKEGEA